MATPDLDRRPEGAPPSVGTRTHDGLHELLTVEDVAALFKVSRSWVYEHTRVRKGRAERLRFVKIGKYVRFEVRAVEEFLAKRSRIA
jgi:excisionase family DNA binding protein